MGAGVAIAAGRVPLEERSADQQATATLWQPLVLLGAVCEEQTRAVDLASFAIDGGRVESIERTIPDPPLSIITRVVPSSADAGAGYLVVPRPRVRRHLTWSTPGSRS